MASALIFDQPTEQLWIAYKTVHKVRKNTYLIKTYGPFGIPYDGAEIQVEEAESAERFICEGNARRVKRYEYE